MGREHLKFRVWEPLNKTLRQPNLALYFGDNDESQKRFILPTSNQSLNRAFTTMNLDAVKIMQYTGLKDRNGVEIWEGDLLEEEAGYLFEVVWDKEWAKFRLQWRTKAIQYPEWNRGKMMAVVGNIYQHSHLLEPQ